MRSDSVRFDATRWGFLAVNIVAIAAVLIALVGLDQPAWLIVATVLAAAPLWNLLARARITQTRWIALHASPYLSMTGFAAMEAVGSRFVYAAHVPAWAYVALLVSAVALMSWPLAIVIALALSSHAP